MNYKHMQYPQKDNKMQQLEKDNQQLSLALQQLNECYQIKVEMLENQVKKHKKRQEQLLEWKSQYIDNQLFQNKKYQTELEKMIQMMEQTANNFQEHKQQFSTIVAQKDEEISQLKYENDFLKTQRDTQDQKIQHLAKKYIVQIERLNNQLKQLKQEVNFSIADVNNSIEDSIEQSHKDENETEPILNSEGTPLKEIVNGGKNNCSKPSSNSKVVFIQNEGENNQLEALM